MNNYWLNKAVIRKDLGAEVLSLVELFAIFLKHVKGNRNSVVKSLLVEDYAEREVIIIGWMEGDKDSFRQAVREYGIENDFVIIEEKFEPSPPYLYAPTRFYYRYRVVIPHPSNKK